MNLDDKLKDKDLENLMGDNFKKETPSSNFTHLVMQKVVGQEIKSVATSTPLVGKIAWWFFAFFGIVISLSLIYNKPVSQELNISFPEFDFTNFEGWYGISLSIILAVVLLIFADSFLRKVKEKTKI